MKNRDKDSLHRICRQAVQNGEDCKTVIRRWSLAFSETTIRKYYKIHKSSQ